MSGVKIKCGRVTDDAIIEIDGQRVISAKKVDISLTSSSIPLVSLEVLPEDIEIEDGEVIKLSLINPLTGETKRVKKVIFDDHTTWQG